jgi:nucleoside-diphosphate-sugar epimerase
VGKVLVTGATGFTGGNLCRRLRADGEQVVAFHRPTSRLETLQAMGVECRPVDIKDSEAVKDNFTGIDKVFHIAAAYRTEHSDQDEFSAVNIGATRNLLEAAKSANVRRFIHCSTVGVQGEIEQPPADEAYRFAPGDHYQESKLKGELLARDYFANGLKGTIVRPVGIYGPGDTRFLKLFRPISKGRFIMIGSGEVLYHMTFIDDLIQGFILAGSRDEALGEVYTIAGETYTTLRELVDLIADVLEKPHPRFSIPFWPVLTAAVVCDKACRLVGVSPPLYPRRVEFFSLDRAFSIAKAKAQLGYRPAVGLREGLSRTAAWYIEKGLI